MEGLKNMEGQEGEVIVSLNSVVENAVRRVGNRAAMEMVKSIVQEARRICPRRRLTMIGLSWHKNITRGNIIDLNEAAWKACREAQSQARFVGSTGWLGPKLLWDNDKGQWERGAGLIEMGTLVDRLVLGKNED